MRLLLTVLMFIGMTQSGCLYIARYDGPYEGKVVDANTSAPIEGAVVLGIWNTETPTLGGAVHHYYDARESVTDKNGVFSIPGQGLRILSILPPATIIIFKSGYEYWGEVPWKAIKNAYRDKVTWEGEKPIIPIKKLSMEERKKQGTPEGPPSEALFDKVKYMLREIDKDRKERGLDARGSWRGEKYD